MPVIKFADLWKSHPLNWNPSEAHPCRLPNGTWEPSLDNQCAIKMSIALTGAGLSTTACPERKCWLKGHKGHVLAAQKLADWLALRGQLGAPSKLIKGKGVKEPAFQTTVSDSVSGKKGIVFCRNFWGDTMTGDHIDVWDGTTMGGGFIHDYFGRSDQVWFWRITV